MPTLKQREKLVASAIKKIDAAADALAELNHIAAEFGVQSDVEEKFSDGLRERANYWEKASWWKK